MRRCSAFLAVLMCSSASSQSSSQVAPAPQVTAAQRGSAIERIFGSQTPEQEAEIARRLANYTACRRAWMNQTYLPQPLLWELRDADTTITLLGTVHRLPTFFDWQSEQIRQIVTTADLLVNEDGAGRSATRSNGFMPDGDLPDATLPKLADRVDGERRAKLQGIMAFVQDDVAARFDAMPTWLAAAALVFLVDRNNEPSMGPGVDDQLRDAFKKRGRPIVALENAVAVRRSVSTIPEERQRELLRGVLDNVGNKPRTIAQRLLFFHRYAKGEPSTTPFEMDTPGIADDLRDRLLVSRNQAWAADIAGRLAQPGSILVAVGAAHFAGQDSLLKLLRDRGLDVRQISPATQPRPRPAFRPKPATSKECSAYMQDGRVPEAYPKTPA